jgi:hypothetical protein
LRPGPVGLLEEMQRRHPDQDWDRLRRSLEGLVRAWRAEHGADREVIFRQGHVPGQQALSDFADMADAGISIAGQMLNHRPYGQVIDAAGNTVRLPRGASDAYLAPYHVSRSQLVVLLGETLRALCRQLLHLFSLHSQIEGWTFGAFGRLKRADGWIVVFWFG